MWGLEYYPGAQTKSDGFLEGYTPNLETKSLIHKTVEQRY